MAYTQTQRHDVRLLAAFRSASYLGDTVALIALFLRLAPLGHAWAIAALSIAGALPLVVLASFAGKTVDRQPAKRLLVVVGFLEALVCVAIGYWHGEGATLALMLLLSSCVAFSMPGYSALVPHVAGEENTAASQGLMQSMQGVAGVAGPALGGLLVGWSGQSWPLYIDAMSFALCALGTALLHNDRRPSPQTAIEILETKHVAGGVRLVLSDMVMRPIIIATSLFMLTLGMVNVAEVFFATKTLHASALGYGLIGTSFGLGTIIGSLYAGQLKLRQLQLVQYVLLSILAIGVLIGSGGLVTHIIYMYPLLLLAGIAVGIVNVTFNTLFIKRTPEENFGRGYAAIGAMFTTAQIGATALGGLVLTLLAPRTVFQLCGVLSTMTVVVLGPVAWRASRAAHLRELDL